MTDPAIKAVTNGRYIDAPLTQWGHSVMSEKSSLIDSNAEIANEAEGASHRERLSEKTAQADATVRSASNRKMQRLAEMTSPAEKRVTYSKHFVASTIEGYCSRAAA